MLSRLKKLLGSENFFEDRASIIALSPFPVQAKDDTLPLAALYPRHEGHIRDILNFCAENDFTLRIRGGGTSGLRQKPHQNELLLLTGGLNRVLALEEENRLLIAQSGLSLVDLEKRLASSGLFLPFHLCKTSPATLGGRIAANSPDLFSLAYGCPGHFVQELEVFLSTGEKCLLSCQNDQPLVSAFPLGPLFIGSRGQLGLISAVKIRLLPRPSASKSFIIPCANNQDAVQASSLILNSGLTPVVLEIISADVASYCAFSCQPCLYVSFSGTLPFLAEQQDHLYNLFESAGPRLLSGQENDSFLASYSTWSVKLQAKAAFSLIIKAGCPQNKLSCFIKALEEILHENDVKTAFTIHAGLASAELLIYGPSLESLKLAEKNIFTRELMLNNRMRSEDDAGLTPDEWHKLHDEDMRMSQMIAKILDPCKIFSASLF